MARHTPFRAMWHASWIYPFKGIYYFVAHPYFYPLFRARLVPIVLLSLFIYTNLFLFAYLPQVAFLTIFHGAGAWFNATILVLSEGAVAVALLFEAFFVDETCVDVFDAVLLDRGCGDLVERGRTVDPSQANSVKMLGRPFKSAVYSPFSVRQIVEFIVLLPLNLVPVVGVPVFLLLTGYRAGPLHHWRYFKLMDMPKKERKEYTKKRKIRYMWFGTVALCLQLIPVLSMFFLLSTSAGSALWVADIEKARKDRENANGAVEQEYGEERYRDNPL